MIASDLITPIQKDKENERSDIIIKKSSKIPEPVKIKSAVEKSLHQQIIDYKLKSSFDQKSDEDQTKEKEFVSKSLDDLTKRVHKECSRLQSIISEDDYEQGESSTSIPARVEYRRRTRSGKSLESEEEAIITKEINKQKEKKKPTKKKQ